MTTNEELEIASAYLPGSTITELLARRDDLVVAGSDSPAGRARRTEGGLALDGRWRFVTGSPAADYLVVGSLVDDGTSHARGCATPCSPPPRPSWQTRGTSTACAGPAARRRGPDLLVAEAWTGVIRSPLDTVPDTTLYRLPSTLRFPIPKTRGRRRHRPGRHRGLHRASRGEDPVSARSQLPERPDAARAVAEAAALRALRLGLGAGGGRALGAGGRRRADLA